MECLQNYVLTQAVTMFNKQYYLYKSGIIAGSDRGQERGWALLLLLVIVVQS